jgi:hypothetical protein
MCVHLCCPAQLFNGDRSLTNTEPSVQSLRNPTHIGIFDSRMTKVNDYSTLPLSQYIHTTEALDTSTLG